MVSRPDLSGLDPEIRQYIESLEAEVASLRKTQPQKPGDTDQERAPVSEPGEPPTTIQVITLTRDGNAKRTPRHLYSRQRRGGMGVFDLDTPDGDPPAMIALADEAQHLILFTNTGRAFRVAVHQIEQSEIRARGKSLTSKVSLMPGERISAVLPDQARGAVALVTRQGFVRLLRHHIFGEYMRPGTGMIEAQRFGEITAACWTSGNDDLFIATRHGRAIRFQEKIMPPQGIQGIRLEQGDYPVGLAPVREESHVFMADAQGLGTVRLMSGFSANKSAGGGGKIAMKTTELVSVQKTDSQADIFLLSRLSKLIRFAVEEVPVKEDPVQGVRCMDLRADEVVAGVST